MVVPTYGGMTRLSGLDEYRDGRPAKGGHQSQYQSGSTQLLTWPTPLTLREGVGRYNWINCLNLLSRLHHEMKLKQNSFKTVSKQFWNCFVFCFSQNKTLWPWKILVILANHCRYPL